MEIDCLEISTRNIYIIYPLVKYLLRIFYSAQWQISVLSPSSGAHGEWDRAAAAATWKLSRATCAEAPRRYPGLLAQ